MAGPRNGTLGQLRLGTSAFTARGWEGSFYPPGMDARDYLSHYARHFDSVELDVTFYRIPSEAMVRSWYERTPEGFVFSAKVPRPITHEKVLGGCDAELDQFLNAMEGLREKLGPLLFQFPYFNKRAFVRQQDFLRRLEPFLERLPREFAYAVEVRNKWWVNARLIELLGKYGVACTLIDHPWMHPPEVIVNKIDPITAEFTYIRWLGDRKGIEEITETWDGVVVDRSAELHRWVEICHPIRRRGVTIFGYVNNHYSGHAPATAHKLLELLHAQATAPKM